MVLPNILLKKQDKRVSTQSHYTVSTHSHALMLNWEGIKNRALQKLYFYSGFSLTTQIMKHVGFQKHEARRNYKLFEIQDQNSEPYWETSQKSQNQQGKIQSSGTNTYPSEREIKK